MLRLLNRVKRNLLKEGKIKSFLFYTVGEVFLVVVGILIALQIDNWDRRNQEDQELDEFLNKIAENITEDLILADSLLDMKETSRKIARKTLDAIINNKVEELDLVKDRINVFVDFSFVPKKSGFASLTNSGYIGKLKRSKLDSLLFQYYHLVEDLKKQEESFNGYIEAMEAHAGTTSNFSFMLYQEVFDYPLTDRDKKEALKSFLELPAVQNALTRGAFQNAVISRYEKVISTGNLLKQEIEKKTVIKDDR